MPEFKRIDIITPGHRYELESVEGTNYQQVQFIEKENRDGEFVTINDGTTNEAVLEMLIDRLTHLNGHVPSVHNEEALRSLNYALLALEARTRDREDRGVEGTPAE